MAHTRVVCELGPTKDDPNRTRITIGGNTIAYFGDTGTKTGSLELVKCVLNSVVSRPKAKFMTIDISNYYLNTPLDRPEFCRIKLEVIPQQLLMSTISCNTYTTDGFILK